MRQRFLTFVSVFFLAASVSSGATPCKTEDRTPSSSTPLGKYLVEQFQGWGDTESKLNQRTGDLLFVFIGADGKFDPQESVRVSPDPNKSSTALPSEIFTRAKKAGVAVEVFHRNFSGYVIPVAADRMKDDFQPSRDCPKAEKAGSMIAFSPDDEIGCEALDLSTVTAATFLYDQSEAGCAVFSSLAPKIDAGKIKKGSKEEGALKNAIQSFNTTFGSDTKIGDFTGNRTPGFSKITYAPSKSQAIGTSGGTPPKKKSSETIGGN